MNFDFCGVMDKENKVIKKMMGWMQFSKL